MSERPATSYGGNFKFSDRGFWSRENIFRAHNEILSVHPNYSINDAHR